MKQALLLWLVLVATASADLQTQHRAVLQRKKMAAGTPTPTPTPGGCTTLVENAFGSPVATTQDWGITTGTDWWATVFIATESGTRCAVEVEMFRVGVGFDFRFEIWTFNAAGNAGDGAPGTLISAGATITGTSVSPFPDLAFTRSGSMTASVTSGTMYCIVLHRMSGTVDGSNFFRFNDTNISDPGYSTMWTSTNGTSWTQNDIANINCIAFKVYK